MKYIGFIDYFIDEWHADNYPEFIRQSKLGDNFDVLLAWEETTPPGCKSLDQWCAEQKVGKAGSIEEVIEKCDCLIVLSPDNVERHEDLADLPLRSGKPVYVDKPFAPTLEAARRMFAKAEQFGTPLMSTSALRYETAIKKFLDEQAGKAIHTVLTRGGGRFEEYAVHQLEMLVMVLGTGARRVMQCGNPKSPIMMIDYADGRRGSISQLANNPMGVSVQFGNDQAVSIEGLQDFFPGFIDSMLGFLDTGVSQVPMEQTLEVVALLEAGIAALKSPDTWVSVPS
jgi:hypothetical protein